MLFLVADTGGGHRSAAGAVAEALERGYPGRYRPVLVDPLCGPLARPALRRIAGLYGPVVRRARWLWALAYHLSNSRWVMRLLWRGVLGAVDRPVAAAALAHRPAVIVSFHPLATRAAVVASRRQLTRRVPVLTVVTDLSGPHAAWRYSAVDGTVMTAWDRGAGAGLPVGYRFRAGPATAGERARLRRALGVDPGGYLVVLMGGLEGCGGMERRAAAIVRALPGVDVVALCGRNERLRRRLQRLADRPGVRLAVHGFVDNVADWFRCADVVVGKAGPGTIAETACCGTPLLITSHLPGQETGNVRLVVDAGAGWYAPRPRQLVRMLKRLRADPAAMAAARAAATRLGRPGAADTVARRLVELTSGRRRALVTVPPNNEEGQS